MKQLGSSLLPASRISSLPLNNEVGSAPGAPIKPALVHLLGDTMSL